MEELPQFQAIRTANKGVIMKLITESKTILEMHTEMDDKTGNRLFQNKTMLMEKFKVVTDLDEQNCTRL